MLQPNSNSDDTQYQIFSQVPIYFECILHLKVTSDESKFFAYAPSLLFSHNITNKIEFEIKRDSSELVKFDTPQQEVEEHPIYLAFEHD